MSQIKAGICLNLKSEDNQSRHLWIVITDPSGEPPSVALVNLTSYKFGHDETVVLNVGDHGFVKRKTIVNYAKGIAVRVSQLENLIEADLTVLHKEECSPKLLARIQQGVFDSPFARPNLRTYCEERFGRPAATPKPPPART